MINGDGFETQGRIKDIFIAEIVPKGREKVRYRPTELLSHFPQSHRITNELMIAADSYTISMRTL